VLIFNRYNRKLRLWYCIVYRVILISPLIKGCLISYIVINMDTIFGDILGETWTFHTLW